MSKNKKGFTVVEALIILVVFGGVGFVGYKVFSSKDNSSQNSQATPKSTQSTSSGPVKWAYNQNEHKWFVQSGKAPLCKNPFKFDYTPADISTATASGFPGAYRGFSYKAHGAFRFDNSPDGSIEVKMPMDANLTDITRYYESTPGNPYELQYLLSFENDCGIAFRFDHINTLTPKFQALAEKTPEPKKDDTRSTPGQFTPVFFKAGEVVATKVGFVKAKNFGFDFGVYDYRKNNEISKNAKWAAIHAEHSAQDYNGVCWFDMLPGADVARATVLSQVTINPSKPNRLISDYCKNAKHTTLDFNNGQPIDG